ncbi:MAG: Hsp33 family molecular chaperone HslO [Bacillota bacterium]|nr:Hsp33 family molecular chaperone HslO [Bacillota bacterium]
MDKIIRCITTDGGIMAFAIDSSDIVHTAKKLHCTSPCATAALGRLITAASMMGSLLKQSDASVTLRVCGDGPLGAVIAVSDSHGNCRGYVENPDCKTIYYENGKINVGDAVGKNGVLNVMRDLGSGDPYLGQIELVSGEIAEDITEYFAKSEQIPTVCALGVLLDKNDGEVLLSGGLLIQVLPGATDEEISKLEENINELEPVTTMLAKGMSIKEICDTALKGFEVEVLDETEINYVCTCSKEKVIRSIIMLPDDDIRSLADEKGVAEAKCHFCNKNYCFTKEELEEIILLKK